MRQLKISRQVTNRDTESFEKYLNEISKIELISVEEETEIAQKIKIGDKKALNRLINANLRFVISVSKQYQNQGISLSDLINEGNLGLIKAAQRFDETRGFKFISYAVWWIRQSILQAIAEKSRIVRIPQNKISSINKILRIYSKLEQDYEREPTTEEIAYELDIAPKDVKNVLFNSGRHISMDAPLVQDEENNLYDTFVSNNSNPPDFALLNDSLRKEIDRVISTLDQRESEIIRLFYGLNNNIPLSIKEISEQFDLTTERVRQIKDKAIRKLQTRTISKLLRAFLSE